VGPDLALVRTWRKKLRESGFVDQELPDGTMKGPQKPPGRWRSFDAASPVEREATGEYFRRAEAFCGSSRFARLAPKVKAVWRLHARGQSNTEVEKALGYSIKTVRNALRAARLAAGLPESTSSIGHGK
jgi:DNA-binding NarL/FixJ family response regulator